MDKYSVITKLPGHLALFSDPAEVVHLTAQNIEDALAEAKSYAEAGGFVLSLLKYQLGDYFAFGKKTTANLGTLLFYDSYHRYSPIDCEDFALTNLRLAEDFEKYKASIDALFLELQAGNTYQVNYTTSLEFNFYGCPQSLFFHVLKTQPTPYNTIVRLEDEYVISASPELFFESNGANISCRPMKGTSPLEAGASYLSADAKNIAENVMIVDLIRNDLNMICDDVRVPKLLEVEKYKSLYQMTSTITGVLRDRSYYKTLKALFPCGSITGAPKFNTMKIIERLEASKRGIYTGSIGYYHQDKSLHSIAIRTLEISGAKGRMGVGGGITICSEPEDEYNEIILKTGFLTKGYDFNVFESLLWDSNSGSYRYLDEHISRIGKSLALFGIRVDAKDLVDKLEVVAGDFVSDRRVRLSVDYNGMVEVASFPISAWSAGEIKLQEVPDRALIFTQNKTSRRLNLPLNGLLEYILHTKQGEILEGSISNLFLKIGGKYYTPPVSSGLLPGIERDKFMRENAAIEKRLFLPDIARAEAIVFTNSVRGVIESDSIKLL